MKRLDWADRRAPEFDGIDPDRAIAILPTAAIEQQDDLAVFAERLIDRLAERSA